MTDTHIRTMDVQAKSEKWDKAANAFVAWLGALIGWAWPFAWLGVVYLVWYLVGG